MGKISLFWKTNGTYTGLDDGTSGSYIATIDIHCRTLDLGWQITASRWDCDDPNLPLIMIIIKYRRFSTQDMPISAHSLSTDAECVDSNRICCILISHTTFPSTSTILAALSVVNSLLQKSYSGYSVNGHFSFHRTVFYCSLYSRSAEC